MDAISSDLQAFRQFIDDQVQCGSANLSPEDALDLFRAQQPTAEEYAATVAAIKEAAADMEAGDVGRSALDVIDEIRAKHGLHR